MKRRAPACLNALCLAKMIRYLQDVPSNVAELAEVSGLAEKTTRKFVLALAREKAIRVVGWEQDRIGRWTTKVYAFGEGQDMKKPPPVKSLAERQSERRARRAQMGLQNTLAGVA